jgi:hypothetical protein
MCDQLFNNRFVSIMNVSVGIRLMQIREERLYEILFLQIEVRGCNQKFPDWPPGARTANGRALCH